MAEQSKPFRELDDGRSSREPTKEELAEADIIRNRVKTLQSLIDTAQSELDSLILHCPHTLSIDEIGYVYHTRRCYACDEYRSTI